MSKLALLITAIAAMTLTISLHKMATTSLSEDNYYLDAYNKWKSSHKRLYSSVSEDSYRLSVFTSNLKYINESNSKPEHTFTLGLNKYSDLTQEEFAKQYLGYIPHDKSQESTDYEDFSNIEAPEEIDWENNISPVKDQGQCGSCWAFATTASLEFLSQQKTGNVESFSEQQLVDCNTGSLIPPTLPNMGCSGGNPLFALNYVSWKGIMKTEDYHYRAKRGKCKYHRNKTVFKNGGTRPVIPFVGSILKSVSSQRVVAVAIYATPIQQYQSGIYNGSCLGINNHAVTLTGYGSDNGKDYWRIKNSWGADWGERGFFRLARSDGLGRGQGGVL